jgi:hypothetical protein
MKIKLNTVIVFFVTLLFFSCGEGIIDLGSAVYTPKIVVEGYLQPNKKVRGIIISRNFPLNGEISVFNYFIPDAKAKITDLEMGKQYQLSYNNFTTSYEYSGNDLIIEYNRSYKLEIEANIDGKTLYVQSITTTPQKGFRVDRNLSLLGEMTYNQKDEFDNTKYFNLVFDPSPGTDFYMLRVTALEPSVKNFIIYDGLDFLGFSDAEIQERLKNFRQRSIFQLNINSYTLGHNFKIDWENFWFYTDFEVILLACDKNFKEYFLTIDKLSEIDGSYREPLLNFEGDGVGVFGSYIAETLYCRVMKWYI